MPASTAVLAGHGGLALSGVTVIDLTTGSDGPFCTKLMADLGARVIKVEPPEGDPSRYAGPFPGGMADPERSALFLYLNANKEGVTLDLSGEHGRDLLRGLLRVADVLVENFAPGTMQAWGLGYADVESLNPGLVYTSITPFGQTGPYGRFHGPDIVRQAYGCWMVQGGLPEREPLKSGGDLSYYLTGVCSASVTLMALLYESITGLGQHVDVSAMEALITCGGQEIYKTSDGGDPWERTGHADLPQGVFPAKDGLIGINLLFAANWRAFCEWAAMEDLLENERYRNLADLRLPGRGGELSERVAAWTSQHEQWWLLEEGQKRRISIALIPTMADLIELPQHRARDFLVTLDHPAGRYVQPGAPFKMGSSRWAIRKLAPALGEDNDAILGSWQ
jgi:crotonobetainyl-CoA:carnitine CoA-transferase CaiB-like acyl-CoA transferase